MFNLYSDSVDSSVYSFSLDKFSKAKYLLSKDLNDLKILFNDPDKEYTDQECLGSFEDTFHISGIYNTQKDIAEEIVLKSLIYNKAYKKQLKGSFPDVFSDASLSNRIILGNYTEPEEIHKRPMSKFMQDIARDVGLIL